MPRYHYTVTLPSGDVSFDGPEMSDADVMQRAQQEASFKANPPKGTLERIGDAANDLGNRLFESAAHPQSASDLVGLMLPTGAGGVMKGVSEAVSGYANAAKQAAGETPSMLKFPSTMLKVLARNAGAESEGNRLRSLGVQRYMPNVSGDVTQGVETGPLPTGPMGQVERYMPNVSGAVSKAPIAAEAPMTEAQRIMQQRQADAVKQLLATGSFSKLPQFQ